MVESMNPSSGLYTPDPDLLGIVELVDERGDLGEVPQLGLPTLALRLGDLAVDQSSAVGFDHVKGTSGARERRSASS